MSGIGASERGGADGHGVLHRMHALEIIRSLRARVALQGSLGPARQGEERYGSFRAVYFFLAEPGRVYMRRSRQITKRHPFGGRSKCARETRGTDQESSKGREIIM